MTERGLVRKEQCPDDRRGFFVVLASAGRRAIEAAASGHVAAVRHLVIDRLDPGQLDAVGAVAEAVLAGLNEPGRDEARSEEHTSELQSLMRISYDVFCLKKKTN